MRFQNGCTMWHKSRDGVKTCFASFLFHFWHWTSRTIRTHRVIDARLFSSSAPLKALTKPLNQSCSICNGDLKESDPSETAGVTERCGIAGTCQGVNFLVPPGCTSSCLPAAGNSLQGTNHGHHPNNLTNQALLNDYPSAA